MIAQGRMESGETKKSLAFLLQHIAHTVPESIERGFPFRENTHSLTFVWPSVSARTDSFQNRKNTNEPVSI